MNRCILHFSLLVLLGLSACSSNTGTKPIAIQEPITPAPAHTAVASVVMAEPAPAKVLVDSTPIGAPVPMPILDASHRRAQFAPQPNYQPPLLANTERYQAHVDNPEQLAADAPVSTFSLDVDTGSYSNVRRMLEQGRWPDANAVRVEEMVNYFPYDYAQPQGKAPFAVSTELAPAPWNSQHVLLRIGVKAQQLARQDLPPANLVFLIDVSGSMAMPNKLELLKPALKLLVQRLRPQDTITIVTYAGDTGVRLPPTSAADQATILASIDSLRAEGGTNGASGIQLAYSMAQQHFIAGGINRILLATDGDFNVGVTDFDALKAMVAEQRKSGVSLSTLGFGVDNYNDRLMTALADAGNGKYAYIDNLLEGQKVLVSEIGGTLDTVAKDVKAQIEFNPALVKEYRLLGYEKRMLQREDFNNDKVDAGDIGAGHSVTALYELTLADQPGLIDSLRYQVATLVRSTGSELAYVKLRYKAPDGDSSRLLSFAVQRRQLRSLAQSSDDFRFAAAVAGYGQILRGGRYTGQWQLSDVRALAEQALGEDRAGYRHEFLRLVDLAAAMDTHPSADAVQAEPPDAS